MEIWILVSLPVAALVLLIDYLLRRKKWKENTTGEKVSLIVNVVSIVPYMILSAYGVLMGITGYGTETAFGTVLVDIVLAMGGVYFIVALAAVVATLILRKVGKNKASVWVNLAAIAYIVVVALVYFLAYNFL